MDVRDRMKPEDSEAPVIVVGAPDIPAGIVGLVAARLVDEFYRPSLVYSTYGDGLVRGSARSIAEFDVTDALSKCADLLTRFGGHHRAAGFSALESDLPTLRGQLLDIAGATLDGVDLRPHAFPRR